MFAVKTPLIAGLAFILSVFLTGCWVAHVAHDRPELRANVGRKAMLTEPYCLFRDRGGRLHLDKEGAPTGYSLIEKLPIGSVVQIKDVIYRISEPGRHDYYVVNIATSTGLITVEVPAEERNRPAWRYD
jgi:hypothetical protein